MQRRLCAGLIGALLLVLGACSSNAPDSAAIEAVSPSPSTVAETTSPPQDQSTCADPGSNEDAAWLRGTPDVHVSYDVTLDEAGRQFCRPVPVSAAWYKITFDNGAGSGGFTAEPLKVDHAQYNGASTLRMQAPSGLTCHNILVVAYLGEADLKIGEIPRLQTDVLGDLEPKISGRALDAKYYAASSKAAVNC